MTALSEPKRRRRFERAQVVKAPVLSSLHIDLIGHVCAMDKATISHLAAVTGLGSRRIGRYMRYLFDHDFVSAFHGLRTTAAGHSPIDACLALGSGPNVYRITPRGLAALDQPANGRGEPPSPILLAHDLAVSDVYAWARRMEREVDGLELERWVRGNAAQMSFVAAGRAITLRADAWLILRIPRGAVINLVEVDKGTERGVTSGRWPEKIERYSALFASGELARLTGYRYARTLITVPTNVRRDALSALIAKLAPLPLQSRFWLAEHSALLISDVNTPIWRRPGIEQFCALIQADE